MKRVVILGRGASGKSTLAKRLGKIMRLPVIELDKVFWRDGLLATPRGQWVVLQEKLVTEDGWIMDGDLGPHDAVEVRLRAADTIIFWTSRLSAVPGEQCDDLASVPTSGVGWWRIAFKVVRFSCRQSLPTRHLRISMY